MNVEFDQLRHAPIQDRANQRVSTILSAAETVIKTLGRDSFTTKDIADLAGCAVGTVYRYFPNRVAVLDALYPDRDEAQNKLTAIVDYLNSVNYPFESISPDHIKQLAS